jgi:hypothetical protein
MKTVMVIKKEGKAKGGLVVLINTDRDQKTKYIDVAQLTRMRKGGGLLSLLPLTHNRQCGVHSEDEREGARERKDEEHYGNVRCHR